ncbi:thymidylate synthase [Halobium salinum]|uniref:Thymidylate synthase n=1 Tax=Halobium salinum TaxID=1364940 RepID=A0ABD5PEX0_9EURY|nr:thymidylate synthase [Halobium salinum]
MDAYLDLVSDTLTRGHHKSNRTGVDTVATFGQFYDVDLAEGFPLLTTKQMDGFRWDSMIHELLWYLSGEEHVRSLRERTGIWDEWADEEGRLDTAYGRFWRRFPVPDSGLEGESWPDDTHRWMNEGERTFDQIAYVMDTLRENPRSRRMVVNAWHPANAAVSTLPPCHYTFVFNVQGDGTLNVHLTQRSGDVALGIPFNIAAYALLAKVVAQRTGFDLGRFAHTVVDAHVYCGAGDRGAWYADELPAVSQRIADAETGEEYEAVAGWVEEAAPGGDGAEYDHVPNLVRQLGRDPLPRPEVDVADVPLDELTYDDIQLKGYESHDGLSFEVAE